MGSQTTLEACSSTLRLRRGPRSVEVEVSSVRLTKVVGEEALGEPLAVDGSVTGAGGGQLVKRVDYRARWREWAFLASYIKDALVGPFYDPILEPKPGAWQQQRPSRAAAGQVHDILPSWLACSAVFRGYEEASGAGPGVVRPDEVVRAHA